MPYIGAVVAILALMFAMLKYFESRIDKKFDKLEVKMDKKFEIMDAKFEAMDAKFDKKFDVVNGQIFSLAMALRPHIEEVQSQPAWVA